MAQSNELSLDMITLTTKINIAHPPEAHQGNICFHAGNGVVTSSQNTDVFEVHQIKADTSGTSVGNYTAALMAFESTTGDNYLHTVRGIRKWDTLNHYVCFT